MQGDLQDPRTILLTKIDVSNSRVEFSDTPIVLLCGGTVKVKERPEDMDPPIGSLRDAITRSHTPYEIFRPEEIASWQSDGVFKDLMSFEADLASICSLVVIILESAGSLVELGAFSQLPDLSKKIIAIRSSDFRDDISFINLGILRYIADGHHSGVKSYPWTISQPSSITPEVIEDVVSDIKDELNALKQSQVLKTTLPSHIVVLICELVKLFTALKEHEILEYLTLLHVDVTKEQLRRKLFLLEEFKLIKKEQYSDSIFYMRSIEPYHKLRWAYRKDSLSKSDTHQDTLRIEVECIDYYNKDPKHRHRVRAIKQAEQGPKR